MAKIEVNRDPQPPIKDVVLTLTPKEAVRVHDILGFAGGKSGHRSIPASLGMFAQLDNALRREGLVS